MSLIVEDVCESWDLTPPEIPPRRRLTYLEPVGVGTAFVESLTSYVTRLADEHSVTAGSLIGSELAPLLKRSYIRSLTNGPSLTSSVYTKAYVLNGNGRIAEASSTALESLTMRDDLRFLTMLTWRRLLAYVGLLRKRRAWCSKCYTEQISSNSPVYDQLLWALEDVKACPRHFRGLEITCPHCGRQSRPFTQKMRAGLCNSCGGWLGSVQDTNTTKEVEADADLYEQVGTANLIGGMLVTAPYLKTLLSKEHLASSISKHTNQFSPHMVDNLAKLIKIKPGVASRLAKGKGRVRLCILIRICRAYESPVLDFLNGNDADISTNEITSSKIEKRNGVIRHLQSAVDSPNCPTLTELTRQLGYKRTRSLWLIATELCKKIEDRNRENSSEVGSKNSFYPDHVRTLLADALSEEPPPTVKDVSLRAGYKDEPNFRRKYPDVARLLIERRKEYRKAEYSKLEKALLDALREEPPPSLREVCGLLTYKDKPFKWVQSLVCKFPSLCRAVRARYKTYKIQKVSTGSIRGKAQKCQNPEPPQGNLMY